MAVRDKVQTKPAGKSSPRTCAAKGSVFCHAGAASRAAPAPATVAGAGADYKRVLTAEPQRWTMTLPSRAKNVASTGPATCRPSPLKVRLRSTVV